MVLVVVAIVALVVVGAAALIELVNWWVERKARERFAKMTPEERFKYQNEMRKAEI